MHLCQVSATGLKSADLNGKSDPYVKLMLAGQRAKSKTIMMTLDPQWDESFAFVRRYGVPYSIGCFRPSVFSPYDTWF